MTTRTSGSALRISTLTVALAQEPDLAEAERVMREVLSTDLGGYTPRWHQDLDDLAAAYLRRPGHALLVARQDGELLGTAAVRPCALAVPPNPPWLADRYNRPDVCQLVRVWVAAAGRRRGAGRALVEGCATWATGPGGYATVYLHTDAGVPGAEAFWRSLPTTQVHDARPDPYNCVHFELDVEALLRQAPRPAS
jgi:GNAT superfamily N-acetyltransferase